MEKLLVGKRILPEKIRNESKEIVQLLTTEKSSVLAEPEGRIEKEVKLAAVHQIRMIVLNKQWK